MWTRKIMDNGYYRESNLFDSFNKVKCNHLVYSKMDSNVSKQIPQELKMDYSNGTTLFENIHTNHHYEWLLSNDGLNAARLDQNILFSNFHEAPITYPPTYKVKPYSTNNCLNDYCHSNRLTKQYMIK